MRHPRHLKVDGRPLFKILGPSHFLGTQCSGNATLAQERIDEFRKTLSSECQKHYVQSSTGGDREIHTQRERRSRQLRCVYTCTLMNAMSC